MACVPSICEEMTASLRTKPYKNHSALGTIAPATAKRPSAALASANAAASGALDDERRIAGRQGMRHEGPHFLAARLRDFDKRRWFEPSLVKPAFPDRVASKGPFPNVGR